MDSRILLASFAFSLILVSSLGFADCNSYCGGGTGDTCSFKYCQANQKCCWDVGFLGVHLNYRCEASSSCLPTCDSACGSAFGSFYMGATSSYDISDSCESFYLSSPQYQIAYDYPGYTQKQTSDKGYNCFCKHKIMCSSGYPVCKNGQCSKAETKPTCEAACKSDYGSIYVDYSSYQASTRCYDQTYRVIYSKMYTSTSTYDGTCYCGYKQSCNAGQKCSGGSCMQSATTTTYKATTTTASLPSCSSICSGGQCAYSRPVGSCSGDTNTYWAIPGTATNCQSSGQSCYCKYTQSCSGLGKTCNSVTGTCEDSSGVSCSSACSSKYQNVMVSKCQSTAPTDECSTNSVAVSYTKYDGSLTTTCKSGSCYCGLLKSTCLTGQTCSGGKCITGTATTSTIAPTTTTLDISKMKLPDGFTNVVGGGCTCESGWVPAMKTSGSAVSCSPVQTTTAAGTSLVYDYNLKKCGMVYKTEVKYQLNGVDVNTYEDVVDGYCYTGCKQTTSSCYCIRYADIKNKNPGSCQIACENYKHPTTTTTQTITTTTSSNIPVVTYNPGMKLPDGFSNVEGTDYSKCSCDVGWAPATSEKTMSECKAETVGNLKSMPGNLGKCGSDNQYCFANCKPSKTDYTNKDCYCLQVVVPTKKGDDQCNTECSGYGVSTSPYKITTTTLSSLTAKAPYTFGGCTGTQCSCIGTDGSSLTFTAKIGTDSCGMASKLIDPEKQGSIDASCCCKMSTDSAVAGYTFLASYGTASSCTAHCKEQCNKKGYAQGKCYGCTGNSAQGMTGSAGSCGLFWSAADWSIHIDDAICPSGDESCFCTGVYVATTTVPLATTTTTILTPCVAAGGTCRNQAALATFCQQSCYGGKYVTLKDANGQELACDKDGYVCGYSSAEAQSKDTDCICGSVTSTTGIPGTTAYVPTCPTGTECQPNGVLISICGSQDKIISSGSCSAWDLSPGSCVDPNSRCSATPVTYNPTTTISTTTTATSTTTGNTATTTTFDASSCTSKYGTCYNVDTQLAYCNAHGFGSINQVSGGVCPEGQVCAKAGYAGCTGTTTTTVKATTTTISGTTTTTGQGTTTTVGTTTTLAIQDGSCAGRCGKKSGTCWCDAACVKYGDCCPDAKSICPSLYTTKTTVTTTTLAPATNGGYCTEQLCNSAVKLVSSKYYPSINCATKEVFAANSASAAHCYCDSGCVKSGDCCPDVTTSCSWASGETIADTSYKCQ